jgi:iron complex outermembrane recepter protein
MMTTNTWLDGVCSSRLRYQLPCVMLAVGMLQGVGQAQVPASDPADTPQLQEVVVTAQKRSEGIKEIPLSVTVLSGSALENQKIENYDDLARAVPGLAVSDAGAPNLSRLTLRGVSSSQGTATVGVYLDDISLTIPNLFFTGATLPQLFDLQDVEVLRGPQGTLYGASSLGGTIRFTSNAPKLDAFEGSARLDLANTHGAGFDYLAQAVLNVPLIDNKVALRINVQRNDDAGYVDRIGSDGAIFSAVNDDRTTAARATLLIAPTDGLTIKPALLWQSFETNGTDAFDLSLPRYQQQKLSAEPDTDKLLVPSLSVNADLGAVELVSVSSYVRRTNNRVQDGQVYNSGFVAYVVDPTIGPAFDAIAALPGPYSNDVLAQQWSQELRLRSKSMQQAGRPYEWQVGLYYLNQNVGTLDDEYVSGLGSTLTQLFPGQAPADVLGAPLVNDELGYFHYHNRQRETAIFGEGSYEVLPALKATLGFRQSIAHTDYDISEGGWLALGLPATYSKGGTEHPFIPKVALTYDLSDQATVYAVAAKGFRLGGAGAPLPSSCAESLSGYGISGADNSYRPDSLWSYEGGTKMRLLGNRLSINADAFYIDWSNIQQSLYLPSCGYAATINAGNARSYGSELETSLQVTKDWSVGFSGSIDNAKITKAAPGTGSSDGDWLLGVPKYNFAVSLDGHHRLADELRGYFHTDIDRVGGSFGSFDDTSADFARPAYTTVNMNLGIATGRFDVSVFARNLLNDNTIIQRPALLFINQGIIQRPRTIGVSLRASF